MIVLHNIAIMNWDMFDPLPAGEGLAFNENNYVEETDIEASVDGSLTRQHYVDTYFSN